MRKISSQSNNKILIIHEEGNSFNNPTVKCIIDLFLEKNHTIDIRYANSLAPLPEYRGVEPLPFGRILRKIKSIAYNKVCSWVSIYTIVLIEKFLVYNKYDLIIGIDRQGLLEARVLSQITSTPFVYISFEISFEDETSPRFKSLEKTAAQAVCLWLVQDKIRADQLQSENQLDESKRFLLPLASAGSGKISSSRLRDSLGIPAHKKVAIVIGSISNWSMTSELLHCTADWPSDWVLIVHDRYGLTTELLSEELSSISYLVNTKIYISDAATSLVDDLGSIFGGVSVGLAFYLPDYSSRHTGKNLKHLGLSAGKISTYLRFGVPVIMNNIGLYADEVDKFQFGCVAEHPDQIKDCLEAMDINKCSENAKNYFDQKLDFNIFKDRLYARFSSLFSSAMSGSMPPLKMVDFLISVVIPTRDRADTLLVALKSIKEQSLSKERFEVLVIDNGSTDHTVDIVRSAGTYLPNIKYFFEPEAGLHAGRHRGLTEAEGDVLVYADDDISATPTWLEAIAENFLNPEVSMVGGNNYPDFQGQIPHWLNELWGRQAMGGQGIGALSILSLPEGRRPINPYYVWGCNFSIRKQVVLDAGGFHPDGMPQELIRFRGDGETHISKHVLENKLICMFDSRASVYHAVSAERMTFRYFKKRAFNQGVSDSYTQLRSIKRTKPWSDYPRGVTRWLLKMICNLTGKKVEYDPELQKLFKHMQEGHKEGFEYHQQAYREDSEVRAWVHKSDYFDKSY